MKRFARVVLLLTLPAILTTSPALADHIGIYADQTGVNYCTLNLTTPAPVYLYVLHQFTVGTTSSRWKVNFPPALLYMGYSTANTVFGDPSSDVSVIYGNCLTGSTLVMTLNCAWFGEPVSCGKLEVVAATLPTIVVTDCNYAEHAATGGTFYVDSNHLFCCPDPTEPATWGKVKALYR